MKRDYNLSFIDNNILFTHVKETVEKYRFSIDLKKFNGNLIDPIKLTFDAKVYCKSIEEVVESEILRQFDKSNTNHIGYFHQNIFKYISPDWSVPEKGFDVVNESKKIYVEMKNKHNTMNSSSSKSTFIRMQHYASDPSVTCMLVEIIAKSSQNQEWVYNLNGEKIHKSNIIHLST